MTDKPRGYIAMPRSIFDDKAFAPEPFTEREAFLFMAAAAAWRKRRDRIGRAVVDLDRGQLAASSRFLATRWGWSEARVRRFLARIAKRRTSDALIDAQSDAPSDALIDAVSTRNVTIITIRNYDDFNKSARPEIVESDAAKDAANDAQPDAPHNSKSTQIGETNLEEDNSYIPFPKGNGDALPTTGSNVVTLTKAKTVSPKIPDPKYAQTPAKTVFDECRKFLERSAGLSSDQARRILGRWRKAQSDGDIIDAISRAQREEAQDPVAFVNGCFRQRERPTGALSAIQAMEDVR